MGLTIGLECKAYRNTGTYASPTATEITSVIDVSMNLEMNVATVKSRGNGWEKALGGCHKSPKTIKLLRNNADTDQIAFLAAFIARTMVGLIFADGVFATSGTVYEKGEYLITKYQPGETLEEGTTIEMEVMPYAKSTNDPLWVTVGS
jgi:hypothetical protein